CPATRVAGRLAACRSADRVAAAFGRMLPRRWLTALRRRIVARLWCTLHLALLHLLLTHLHLALLLLHLRGALLLGLLVPRALLFLHLRLTLLLHLLLAGPFLLCLLLACALLRLGLCLLLLLRGAVVDLLRCAFYRPHHGQAARSGRAVPLRFARGTDHGCARQRRGLIGMCESRGGQFIGARGGVPHGVHRRLDRMHRVLERLGRTGTARGRFAWTRCHDGACRLGTRRRFRRSRRRRRTRCCADRCSAGGCANQLHAILARRRLRLAQVLQLRRRQRLAMLAGDDFLARREIDRTRRRLVARDHRTRERLAALDRGRPRRRVAQAQAAPVGGGSGAHRNFGACELGAVELQHGGTHGTRAGEDVLRHRRHGGRHRTVRIVMPAARRHPARTVIAVEIVDDRLVVVHVADVGDVDVGEV